MLSLLLVRPVRLVQPCVYNTHTPICRYTPYGYVFLEVGQVRRVGHFSVGKYLNSHFPAAPGAQ